MGQIRISIASQSPQTLSTGMPENQEKKDIIVLKNIIL